MRGRLGVVVIFATTDIVVIVALMGIVVRVAMIGVSQYGQITRGKGL